MPEPPGVQPWAGPERTTGLEPAVPAWKAGSLPLTDVPVVVLVVPEDSETSTFRVSTGRSAAELRHRVRGRGRLGPGRSPHCGIRSGGLAFPASVGTARLELASSRPQTGRATCCATSRLRGAPATPWPPFARRAAWYCAQPPGTAHPYPSQGAVGRTTIVSGWPDSNWRPPAPHAGALSQTALQPGAGVVSLCEPPARKSGVLPRHSPLVGKAGFEPASSRPRTERANLTALLPGCAAEVYPTRHPVATGFWLRRSPDSLLRVGSQCTGETGASLTSAARTPGFCQCHEVEMNGFEPMTVRLRAGCSTGLSYIPVCHTSGPRQWPHASQTSIPVPEWCSPPWWSYADSNRGPPACHAGALPAAL